MVDETLMRLIDAYADAAFSQGLHQRTEDDAPESKRQAIVKYLAATPAPAPQPLTDEQIVELLYPIYDGLPSLTPITDTKVARATEAACAKAWNIKLEPQ